MRAKSHYRGWLALERPIADLFQTLPSGHPTVIKRARPLGVVTIVYPFVLVLLWSVVTVTVVDAAVAFVNAVT
jgi:hypothetical protein